MFKSIYRIKNIFETFILRSYVQLKVQFVLVLRSGLRTLFLNLPEKLY